MYVFVCVFRMDLCFIVVFLGVGESSYATRILKRHKEPHPKRIMPNGRVLSIFMDSYFAMVDIFLYY